MAQARARRSHKRQLGQYMTPDALAERIVAGLDLHVGMRVLEPSFGTGSFLVPLVRRFVDLYDGPVEQRLERVLAHNVHGVELDPELHAGTLRRLAAEFGPLPEHHGLVCADFFALDDPPAPFDHVVGNPPFGGTFDPELEDALDRRYGQWAGHKVKKETYSFFIARGLEWLADGGELSCIASDTLLTIATMAGLRRRLADSARIRIERLPAFSEETTQGTLVLHARRSSVAASHVQVGDQRLSRQALESTGNFSWGLDESTARYFTGATLGDHLVGTGGMTIGRNELFVREIRDGQVEEHLEFEFFDDPVTLAGELQRARLGRLSPRVQALVAAREAVGETRRNVRWRERAGGPARITLPHPDYRPYNKASSAIVYEPARFAVFWRDDGDAVTTFKRNGNWYLRGVGGRSHFGRSGLTWPLVGAQLHLRWLPPGQILDSGAPCAFLREGVPERELPFILGWGLTDEATRILKTVINHTRNVQGKDLERLPYPWWVGDAAKARAIEVVRALLAEAVAGRVVERGDAELLELEALYRMG